VTDSASTPLTPSWAVREFVTTRWTEVFSAADSENTAAREQLARIYWYPLYSFARWKGLSVPDAEDVVQSFLARLLNGEALRRIAQDGGRALARNAAGGGTGTGCALPVCSG
jgi:RNA polymerase sigma-70 factor (ECF subfamily)